MRCRRSPGLNWNFVRFDHYLSCPPAPAPGHQHSLTLRVWLFVIVASLRSGTRRCAPFNLVLFQNCFRCSESSRFHNTVTFYKKPTGTVRIAGTSRPISGEFPLSSTSLSWTWHVSPSSESSLFSLSSAVQSCTSFVQFILRYYRLPIAIVNEIAS